MNDAYEKGDSLSSGNDDFTDEHSNRYWDKNNNIASNKRDTKNKVESAINLSKCNSKKWDYMDEWFES